MGTLPTEADDERCALCLVSCIRGHLCEEDAEDIIRPGSHTRNRNISLGGRKQRNSSRASKLSRVGDALQMQHGICAEMNALKHRHLSILRAHQTTTMLTAMMVLIFLHRARQCQI